MFGNLFFYLGFGRTPAKDPYEEAKKELASSYRADDYFKVNLQREPMQQFNLFGHRAPKVGGEVKEE